MAIRVMVRFQAKPGQGDTVVRILEAMVPEARAIEGAGAFEMVRGLDDPDTVITIARWRDRAAHDTYVAWRSEIGKEAAAEMAAAVAGPPEVTYAETIAAWDDD